LRLRKKKNMIIIEGKYNTETEKLEWKIRPKTSDIDLVIQMIETMLVHLKSSKKKRRKRQKDISYIS